MDEAEMLCDCVAVVDRGNLVALDTPAALVGGLHAESSLNFGASNGFDPAVLRDLPGVVEVSRERDRVVVRGESSLLAPVAVELDRRGVEPRELKMERATLEDVFLALTGREMRD
jgi:ABC-2 type transport system ATP-binding protein